MCILHIERCFFYSLQNAKITKFQSIVGCSLTKRNPFFTSWRRCLMHWTDVKRLKFLNSYLAGIPNVFWNALQKTHQTLCVFMCVCVHVCSLSLTSIIHISILNLLYGKKKMHQRNNTRNYFFCIKSLICSPNIEPNQSASDVEVIFSIIRSIANIKWNDW